MDVRLSLFLFHRALAKAVYGRGLLTYQRIGVVIFVCIATGV